MVEVCVTGVNVRSPGDNFLWRPLFICCFKERYTGFYVAFFQRIIFHGKNNKIKGEGI